MTPEKVTVRDYLGVLSERRRLIVATTLIAVAIGLAYSLVREPSYEATATIDFKNTSAELPVVTPGVAIGPELNAPQEAAADTRVVTRDDVVNRVQRSISTGMTDDELRSDVLATVQPDSNLVAITAQSADADLSAQLANEFAKQTRLAVQEDTRGRYANDAKELSRSLNSASDPATIAAYRTAIARLQTLSTVADPVEITRPAVVPDSPSSPKPIRDTILAAILGVLIGIGVAFLRNALDRRLRDSHQIQNELGIPLVGYVRADTLGLAGFGRNGDGGVSEDDLEAFRILRRNVDFLAGSEGLSSVVVTSALPEEGKSTVAAWYAYVSAVAGRRTLLVECDLRRPVLARRFGVENAPGIADFLAGDASPRDVLRSIPVAAREGSETLAMIPAGVDVFHPTEAIGSKTFATFVDQITRVYDLVVFDSAPLLPVGDTLELLPLADGVLLCIRLGQTTREQANAAKQAIQHLPDRPTGLVVTGVKSGSDDDYYGYYSYSSDVEGPTAPAHSG